MTQCILGSSMNILMFKPPLNITLKPSYSPPYMEILRNYFQYMLLWTFTLFENLDNGIWWVIYTGTEVFGVYTHTRARACKHAQMTILIAFKLFTCVKKWYCPSHILFSLESHRYYRTWQEYSHYFWFMIFIYNIGNIIIIIRLYFHF